MKSMHYIRFDIHKKAISFCEKRIDGTIVDQGIISATRASLTEWLGKGKLPWAGTMEATMFTGWIYD